MLIWLPLRALRAPVLLAALHWVSWCAAALLLWPPGDEETVPSLVLHAGVLVLWFGAAWSLAATIQGKKEQPGCLPRLVMFAASAAMLTVYSVQVGMLVASGMTIDLGSASPYLRTPAGTASMLIDLPAGRNALIGGLAALVFLGAAHVAWRGLGRSIVLLSRAAVDWGGNRHPWARVFPVMLLCVFVSALVALVGWAQPNVRFIREPVMASVTPPAWSSVPRRDVATAGEAVGRAVQDASELMAWQPGPGARLRDIVVIVSDSLRADRMSVYGYGRQTTPFLSRLQEEGTLQRVDFAFAPCPETLCGIAAILASQGATRAVIQPTTLPILLDLVGYRVNFVLSGFTSSYHDLRKLIGEAPASFLGDGADCGDMAPNDDDCVLRQVERMPVPDDRPSFTFVLLKSASDTGRRDPRFQVFPTEPSAGGIEGARYDGRVLQADSYIERVLSALEDKGQARSPLVLVTADHGEGLGEHGYHGHRSAIYPETVRVPMLFRDPLGEVRLNSTRYAVHADIAVTLLDAVGLPAPARFEGVSLLRPSSPEGRMNRLATFRGGRGGECDGIAAVEGSDVALGFRCPEGGGLYMLSSDPGGRRDLLNGPIGGEGGILGRVRQRVQDIPRR